ncbi:hypothetical protein QBC33DRAFT_524376 [Phialemonium atrogriseum]|uniref:Bromo domain-containing protein n=1 Tax=Phialemonium atrogriseum TaxID=1093897 RepID=A0AAJ0CCB5_9PEZI|nr:uncharacterized protein QBC33DRAFT_524376 [Phialemonium atrogriseum]KAK1771666.1 hypothetical protein QBC33DRAFT_524376 [Phialemonium atrogriseum]
MSGEQPENGVQPQDEAGDQPPAPSFSWLDPHPIFVIVLVGPNQQPFGIQKDFLCARSAYYKQYFSENDRTDAIEHIVELPDTPVQVFALAQNYLFTNKVFPNEDNFPSYEVLIGVWKLGHQLAIDGICDATLGAMAECRRITQRIPATPLLVQVWKDTPEGSSIRKLLLSWAAEYMRSSDSRAEFARSLPQEVLSELVVAMSSLDITPIVQVNGTGPVLAQQQPQQQQLQQQQQQQPQQQHQPQQQKQRNIHYIDDDEADSGRPLAKKPRHSDVLPTGSAASTGKAAARKAGSRASLPVTKPVGKRRSVASFAAEQKFTTAQKLNFCADLLTRMLSGPGFWTRLVGPFKEPVDPIPDGVPDYHEKISKPMDLGTMKDKMDRKGYASEEEFLADMNQIFTNCYTYWTKKDPMWGACEKLQKTFEEKYSQMNKWIAKMEGDEGT